MNNAEEILQCLEEFSKSKPKPIPPELDNYLTYVALTGDTVYHWSVLKCLFKEKLINVITDFNETTPGAEIPSYPNVDPFDYETMKEKLLERLDSFVAAPFTVQRICELLISPRKQYKRIDKFMRAVEKNILVVSVREPARERQAEQDYDDSEDSIVNGSGTNDSVDVEMEENEYNEDPPLCVPHKQEPLEKESSNNANPPQSEPHKQEPIEKETNENNQKPTTENDLSEEPPSKVSFSENENKEKESVVIDTQNHDEKASNMDVKELENTSASSVNTVPKIYVNDVEMAENENVAESSVTADLDSNIKSEKQSDVEIKVKEEEKHATFDVTEKSTVIENLTSEKQTDIEMVCDDIKQSELPGENILSDKEMDSIKHEKPIPDVTKQTDENAVKKCSEFETESLEAKKIITETHQEPDSSLKEAQQNEINPEAQNVSSDKISNIPEHIKVDNTLHSDVQLELNSVKSIKEQSESETTSDSKEEKKEPTELPSE